MHCRPNICSQTNTIKLFTEQTNLMALNAFRNLSCFVSKGIERILLWPKGNNKLGLVKRIRLPNI